MSIKKQIRNVRLAPHRNAVYHTLVQHERWHLIPVPAVVKAAHGCENAGAHLYNLLAYELV